MILLESKGRKNKSNVLIMKDEENKGTVRRSKTAKVAVVCGKEGREGKVRR